MGLESSPQVQQSLISVALQSLTTAVISALLSLPPSPRTAGIFSCNSNQHTGHQTLITATAAREHQGKKGVIPSENHSHGSTKQRDTHSFFIFQESQVLLYSNKIVSNK